VVLEVETNTGKVDEGLDACSAELLGVTWDLVNTFPVLFNVLYLPMPERWRIRGELKVPPLTMICFLAL